MIEDTKNDAQSRMQKSVEALKSELGKVRTGRAHTSLLDQITVEYYGNPTPLSQVASITVTDARTLTVVPWEKNMVSVVEKAILTSGLGLNPAVSGMNIRVPLPPLTEERRKDLIRVVHKEGENARVAIRNIRRDANNDLKTMNKDKTITDDELRKAEDDMQKLTDKYVKEVETIIAGKEKDLMSF